MWFKNVFLFIMVWVYAHAMTEEEMKIEFTKIVMKCTKDHPVEMSELMQLQQLVVPKKKESKCLLACAYKIEGATPRIYRAGNKEAGNEFRSFAVRMMNVEAKRFERTGVFQHIWMTEMNAKGLYDIEHAYKIAELSKNGDEKRLVNAKKIADICVKVNDVEVSDGEKGCERAALIFKCLIETAPKFGFKI